jgi:hypothetical protein
MLQSVAASPRSDSDAPEIEATDPQPRRSGLEPFGSARFEQLMQRITVELTRPERRRYDGRSGSRHQHDRFTT